jgi:hypothetical protein
VLKLNFLEQLDYLDPAARKSSVLAKAMRKEKNSEFDEEIILLFSLLQSGYAKVLFLDFETRENQPDPYF